MGAVKIAQDVYNNNMQFAHLDTDNAANLTTTASSTAFQGKHVVITPVSEDAWVQISSGTITGTVNTGKLIPFGSSYTTIIRSDEKIASSANVNVCPLGEQ